MLNPTVSFLNAVKSGSRRWKSYAVINGTTYYDDIIVNWKFADRISSGDELMIGQTVANSFSITLKGVNGSFDGVTVVPWVGVETSTDVFEYVPLGTFVVEDIDINYDIITLDCIDNMVKFNKLYTPTIGFPNTFTNILNDVCNQAGIPFSGTAPAITVQTIPVGYTCRDVVGFIAAIEGANASVNRSNQLVFRRFTNPNTNVHLSVNGDNYFESGLKKGTGSYTIGRVKGVRKEDNSISFASGVLPNGSRELVFENLWVNQQILDYIGTRLNGITFIPFTMSWQGNPALESGDNLSIDEYRVSVFNSIAMETSLEYDGGLSGTITTSIEGSIRNTNANVTGSGSARYIWMKYADDEKGTNMSDDPTNKKYMGVAYNKITAIESSDPKEYIWSKITGSDATAIYSWIVYGDDMQGSGITTNPAGKLFKGTAFNKTTSTPSLVASDYKWEMMTDGWVKTGTVMIDGGKIYADELSAISGNLGKITAGTINIATDLKVGNNIYLGDLTTDGQHKRISFNSQANIVGGSGVFGANIDVNCDELVFRTTVVDFSQTKTRGLTIVPVFG
jgi:hypothetical protein